MKQRFSTPWSAREVLKALSLKKAHIQLGDLHTDLLISTDNGFQVQVGTQERYVILCYEDETSLIQSDPIENLSRLREKFDAFRRRVCDNAQIH